MYEDDDYEDYELYGLEGDEGLEEQGTAGVGVAAWRETLQLCLLPTLQTAAWHVSHLLISCLLFRLTSQLVNVPKIVCHVSSTLFGVYALYYYFQALSANVICMVVVTYTTLFCLNTISTNKGPIIGLLSFSYLMCCEFFLNRESWQKIRGAQMLVVMKVVSVAFDLDSGTLKHLPDVFEFSGYSLCAGTTVFGAWCSFHEYQKMFNNSIWNLQWLKKAATSLFWSFFYFSLSVCIVEWFIPMESALWWGVYRDALQYRTGHYFVSYLSEAGAVLSGLGSQPDGSWQLTVTEPYHIELPHSLVQVVVYWNKYMHKWLKQYVFRTSSPRFGGLVAVLTTYAVSSLLHGLHYPVAGILMSLGLYTFVEYSLRKRLSDRLSACVASRPCPSPCSRHRHSARLLPVAIVNWVWSALAIFHLAYLGCIIDLSDSVPPPFPRAFQKWSDLHYISHWAALATYVLYFLFFR